MLSSVVFELAAEGRGAAFRGDQAHACLMDMIRTVDPKAAAALHGPPQPSAAKVRGHRPFTVWAGPRFRLGPEGVECEAHEVRGQDVRVFS